MFTSEYSILECPPPLSHPTFLVDRTAAATKWKCSNMEIAPNCPRCASTNTKFCYYNNYSLSQPRYFCKACRRYWTKGGSLRNVPIGGGCRKSRRARSSRQGVGQKYTDPPTLSPGGAATESDSGTRIDLAAVYAKYVNPNIGNEESSSPGASSGSSAENNSYNIGGSSSDHSTDGQIEDVAMMSEYQEMMSVDLISGRGDEQIQQLIPQFPVDQEIDGRPDFAWQDFDGGFETMSYQQQQLGMGMIGDQVLAAANVLWSEEGATLPEFGSQVQPVMQQVQDFGLFSPDDQFRIFENLVVDSLGSFDSSTYGFFFNP
ncbi:hypothetical protein OROGR_021559 [Orobanche gracilis]